MVSLQSVKIVAPENCNLILGQSHFIKTVEDVHEALVNAVPAIEFGLAFCESSGPCLVRVTGNNSELQEKAARAAKEIGAGHSFLVFMRNAYPINVLDKVKSVPEVCNIFAATANPIEVVVAETEQGRGIMGVIDGSKPAGIENEKDVVVRKEFLRKVGYKQ